MAKKKEVKMKKSDRGGLFIPAGLFLGMGIGFATGQLVAGICIGMGLGFLAMALSKNFK